MRHRSRPAHMTILTSPFLALLTSEHHSCGAGFSASPLGLAFPPHLTPTEGLDVMLLTSSHQFPSACKERTSQVSLLALDACVALGWNNPNLLADQTHAEDMGAPVMGLHPLGGTD